MPAPAATDRQKIDAAKTGISVTKTEIVAMNKVQPHPSNARRGDLETIGESLRRNGQYRSIVANRRDGNILAGNHTYLAAQAIGWNRILVSWVDVDDEDALRILLVDNRASDKADYDVAALQQLLRELPSDGGGFRDLEGTGYDKASIDELDKMVAKLQADAQGQGEFPDPPPSPDAYQCPRCAYEWSGNPKPDATAPDVAAAVAESQEDAPVDRQLAIVPEGDPEIDPSLDPDA